MILDQIIDAICLFEQTYGVEAHKAFIPKDMFDGLIDEMKPQVRYARGTITSLPLDTVLVYTRHGAVEVIEAKTRDIYVAPDKHRRRL